MKILNRLARWEPEVFEELFSWADLAPGSTEFTLKMTREISAEGLASEYSLIAPDARIGLEQVGKPLGHKQIMPVLASDERLSAAIAKAPQHSEVVLSSSL